ncbi:MAG TPA: HAMP domain-containing sensor histidine kinase [Longimicrobiales bacterium]
MSRFAGLLLLAASFGAGLLLRPRREQRELEGLQARIRTLENELARSRQRRDQLIAAIIHELRTPLSIIAGYQELLADGAYGPIDQRAREAVDRASRAAEDAIRLIAGLELLAWPGNERAWPRGEPVAPDEILAQVAADARATAAERGGSLEVRISGPLPRLAADPDHMARAVGIALDAALRASPGSRLRLEARASGNQDLVVEVAGTQLSPVLHRPLRGLDEHGETRWGAAGIPGITLRLSIAHRYAQLLGGELTLEAQDDATTLRLRFPGSRARQSPPPATPPAPAGVRPHEHAPPAPD